MTTTILSCRFALNGLLVCGLTAAAAAHTDASSSSMQIKTMQQQAVGFVLRCPLPATLM